MEKTVFKNQNFQALLITALGILFCLNLYNLLFAKSYFSLIPMTIQAVVLYLIFSKDKNAKLGIKAWAVIMMIGAGLSTLGKILKLVIGDDIQGMLWPLLIQLLFLAIGLLCYHYNETTVEVEFIEQNKTTSPPQP